MHTPFPILVMLCMNYVHAWMSTDVCVHIGLPTVPGASLVVGACGAVGKECGLCREGVAQVLVPRSCQKKVARSPVFISSAPDARKVRFLPRVHHASKHSAFEDGGAVTVREFLFRFLYK